MYLISIAIFFLSSCGSVKKIAYFQDASDISINEVTQIIANSEIKIAPNDNLHIMVSALSNEAAATFNVNNLESSITPTSLSIKGYLVDKEGCINFPVIGLVKVGGLTKDAAVKLLQEKIAAYIVDPVVNIRLLNFNISVLGEVAHPGNFIAIDEYITLSEALSMAGDMTIYGQRNNVLVCRENNGKREFARLDLTSSKIFASPYYVLQQNDIIYVQPNKARSGISSYSQNLPLGLSLLSTLIMTVALILK